MQPHHPHVKGENEDFGIPPAKAVEYAKHRGEDHLGRPAGDRPAGSGDSVREHGVGAQAGRRGKGSGGDIDSDMLGLEEPAAGRLDQPGLNKQGQPNIGGHETVTGHTHLSGPDAAKDAATDIRQSGGGIANNTDHASGDDAFVSEITHDDATGADNR